MKTYFYKIIVLLLLQVSAYGQSPNWVVNESQFQYTMSFVSFLNLDGSTLSNTNDKVGAFVNGELRGTANLIYVSSTDRYLAYLLVFSNTTNETVNFKIYNSVNDQVVDVATTVNFEIDRHYGNVFQAFSLASPALSNAANIIDFSFSGAGVTNTTILNSEITIESNAFITQNSSDLNAVFQLSAGANLYADVNKLLTGTNSLNFTRPNTLHVLSADESVLQEWTIEVIPEVVAGNTIAIKAFLQGPYKTNTGLMVDLLRSTNRIPITSPYTDGLVVSDITVFNAGGTSGLGLTQDDIVDWVWIELRNSSDAITIEASASALIQRDGDIVDIDGVSPVTIDGLSGNYYVVLSHRNHLGVLTNNTVSLTGGTTSIDLSNNSTLLLGTVNAIQDMGDGKFALFAGDFNGDGQVQNTDKNAVEPLRGISGYNNADIDLNGEVQNTDLNNLLNPNIGKGQQFTGKKLSTKP
jgi:hypothetical protein